MAIEKLSQRPGKENLLIFIQVLLELYGQVRFAQLYGMGDHISMALGSVENVRVYKSMPYGTVDETLPYIARVRSARVSFDHKMKLTHIWHTFSALSRIDQSWRLPNVNVKFCAVNSSGKRSGWLIRFNFFLFHFWETSAHTIWCIINPAQKVDLV